MYHPYFMREYDEVRSAQKKWLTPLPLGNPRFPSATATQPEHPPEVGEGSSPLHTPILYNGNDIS